MRQRLHRGYQDESSEVEIGNVDLATMDLEIMVEMRERIARRLQYFRAARSGVPVGEDAVKLGIEAVTSIAAETSPHPDLDRASADLEQGAVRRFATFLRVALDDRRDQRLLVREVLVERADADAGLGGDLVGARPVVAFL